MLLALVSFPPGPPGDHSEVARRSSSRPLPARFPRLREYPPGFDRDDLAAGSQRVDVILLPRRCEDHGGGSIGDQGLVDLALVAYEFGRHAAPGPLAGDQRRGRHPQ